MRKSFKMLVLATIVVIIAFSFSQGKKVTVEPGKVTVITSPVESRDTRILVYFDLPQDLLEMKSIYGYSSAVLICEAQVTDAEIGELYILPVTTDWKSKGSISWGSPWSNPGGDYSVEHSISSVALISEDGKKEIKIDVTDIVRMWIDGTLKNRGLIIMPLKDELDKSSVKFSVDYDNLKIYLKYTEFE